MSDFISDTSKAVVEAREKAIAGVRNYAKPKYISAMFEILVSTIVIMGVQLITFGFNIEAMLHWNFWMKVGCNVVAVFMLYRAVINARYEKTASRENVLLVKTTYNDKNKEKDLNMKIWLNKVFNIQTKTQAYIDSINAKISKLERKIINSYNPKKKEKWEERIVELKKLITEEYLISHIEDIRIKYYKVYYSDFQDETLYGKGGIYTRGNYNLAFNMASFRKMWMYVASSVLLGISVFGTGDITAVSVFVSILYTVFIVTTRVVTALLEADQLYDKTITASLLGRIEILDEYIKYKKDHPTQTEIESEKEKIYNALKEELKVEYDKAYEEKLNIEKTIIREECMKLINNETGVA